MLYRNYAIILMATLLAPLGAQAQMRSVVVPADATVTVPSRGAMGPRLTQAPRPRAEDQDAFADEEYAHVRRDSVLHFNPVATIVPAVAAALLGGTLAGSGNGGGAPTRTR